MDALNDLRKIVGDERVKRDAATLETYASDTTENAPHPPEAVVFVRTHEELVAVVRLAAAARVPLVPRVAGTNMGGLTIPARGGWVLDLTGMNKVVSLDLDNQLAVIEPGVTFGQMRELLDSKEPVLTIGYPLSPPESSVMANCLLDGLGNLSLRHGAMGDWVSGLEVVRADGSLVRTGAWALGVPVPFGRAPLPDLTGLFLSWQGTTGIASKMAVQLWPMPRYRERSFVFTFDRAVTLRAMRELPRLDVLNDVGGLSWPTGKLLFGVENPGARDPAEPEFFLYMDMGAESRELLDAKKKVLLAYLKGLRRQGMRIEDPIDVPSLVRVEPRLSKFAEFPTRLDFLLDHPAGGLTWVGTYGPLDRFPKATDRAAEILDRYGFPPIIVARPMNGGHFGVLRFIHVFERTSDEARKKVLACNQELCDALIEEGLVMYKTPGWAVERYLPRLDAGFVRLVREVKQLMDPDGLLNPGRWNV